MTIDKQAQWLCRANAIINWTLSIRGILAPVGMAATFGIFPDYPFVFRLWSGFVFMFGCMFWETGRDVRAKSILFKYNWIEKSVTALAVTIGYFMGDVPVRLMLLIILTNWLWIPAVIYYDFAVRRLIRNIGA